MLQSEGSKTYLLILELIWEDRGGWKLCKQNDTTHKMRTKYKRDGQSIELTIDGITKHGKHPSLMGRIE